MTNDPPGFALDQAIRTSLNQDWNVDFPDPYQALDDWFRRAGERPQNLQPLIDDIDLLFEETVNAETRFERWPQTGLRPDQLDDLLHAMRKRAVDGLAGNAEPMRAP
ncbi:MAG: hypothetical protein JWO22_223 [Frankiales bacterium]|nr:hypothetical protein [Frankiales bacterium]